MSAGFVHDRSHFDLGEPPAHLFDDAPPPSEPFESSPASLQSDWRARLIEAPSQWFTEKPPPRQWLLKDSRAAASSGFLPQGKVGQVIAEGGAGKTMLLVQLGIAVANGCPWLSVFTVENSGRVLLILGEEDAQEMHRRIYNAARAMNAATPDPGRIHVLPLSGVPAPMLERAESGALYDAPFIVELREWLDANGPWALIIVDPLSRFAGPDAEIDNAAATRFIQALETIASTTGACVLVAHHTNKEGRKGGAIGAVAGRGSSALVDGVRWQISLGVEKLKFKDQYMNDKLSKIVVMTHTKTNYTRTAEPLWLRHESAFGGALVTLHKDEIEMVEQARANSPERVAKTEAKQKQVDAKESQEDQAVLDVVRSAPGVTLRDLIEGVRVKARCGQERARLAIRRMHPQLHIQDGARKSQLHYIRGDAAQPSLPRIGSESRHE